MRLFFLSVCVCVGKRQNDREGEMRREAGKRNVKLGDVCWQRRHSGLGGWAVLTGKVAPPPPSLFTVELRTDPRLGRRCEHHKGRTFLAILVDVHLSESFPASARWWFALAAADLVWWHVARCKLHGARCTVHSSGCCSFDVRRILRVRLFAHFSWLFAFNSLAVAVFAHNNNNKSSNNSNNGSGSYNTEQH